MRVPTLPAARIVRGASGAQLSHQFTDSDGEPAAPTGAVTVAVTTSDGTAVAGLSVTIPDPTSDPYTVDLAPADVASVDWLIAEWSVDGSTVATKTVEVVGGVIMDFATASAIDPSLADKSAAFPRARRATEDTITAELGRSPFERFYTERIDGTGSDELFVSWPDVTEVVWVRTRSGSTTTTWTAENVAAITPSISGALRRPSGAVWPLGCQNVEIGYRFGMIDLPTDLRDNLVLAIRHHLAKFKAGLPFLGETINLGDGAVLRANRPGVGASITGNDEVDASIRRHRIDRGYEP